LEQVRSLGIAIFLFIAGPGPVSLDVRRHADRAIEHRKAPEAAITLLRIAMGFGIAYGALTEKLLNPPLAQALLAQTPFLNVLRPFGVGDPVFIWLAGVTELAIGVVILSGQITRPVMAVGFALFTVTPSVFGKTGARYFVQSTITFRNLSAPNRIGATVKPDRRIRYAW